MEELWEPIFQCKQPGSGYMPESFTRAVVSEVLYSTNIDWAKLACAKWRAKSKPTKIYKYSEGGEQLTYKMVIVQRLTCEAEEIAKEIAIFEEKREQWSKILQDTRQQPEVLLKAKRAKEIETNLKKLKKKLQRTKVDLRHSRKMVTFTSTDLDCIDESEKWSQRVTNNEENLESLTTQIRDLNEINRRENAEVLNALATIKDVKVRVADAKARLEQIRNLIDMDSRTTKRPQTISPSSIVGSHRDELDDGCLRPCALCGRGFPHRDVVMASCGCHYHPWCIVTQTWNLGLCFEESCREVFTEPWKRIMDLHYIEGKIITTL